MCKLLNTHTKKAQDIIKTYFNSNIQTVEQCYQNPSSSKRSVESQIKCDMINVCNGFDYRILSYNKSVFTCAFRYRVIHKETGKYVCTVLRYYTPSQTLEMILE